PSSKPSTRLPYTTPFRSIRFSRERTPYDEASQIHVARVPGLWHLAPRNSARCSDNRLYTYNFWQERIVLSLPAAYQEAFLRFDGDRKSTRLNSSHVKIS